MARSIVVIKYNAGNIRSVLCTLNRLGLDAEVTSDASRIRNASRVIFPGVGEASTAMRHLIASGLDELMASLTQPFLGICLGMQLMCRFSEEHDTKCLGIFDLPVVRFPSSSLKVPHMGWNRLKQIDQETCRLLTETGWAYFVHSYYVPLCEHSVALCTYGDITFSAALSRDNFTGFQFHPEKSGKYGMAMLERFIGQGEL